MCGMKGTEVSTVIGLVESVERWRVENRAVGMDLFRRVDLVS